MKDQDPLVILMPVFNDWQSLRLLLPEMDQALHAHGLSAALFIVDDGSSEELPEAELMTSSLGGIQSLEVITLGTNLGHQRAIATGLCYVKTKVPCGHVIVMDSDGQDNPYDIPLLLEKCRGENDSCVIFAKRTKRSEGRMFILSYLCYKRLHKILTGMTMEVGNFCVIPFKLLNKITFLSEIWNHFSAGIIKNRIPTKSVACIRGRRLTENSKMSFLKLVQHGLCAISVFADVIGVRAILFIVAMVAIAFIYICGILALKFATTIPIPGWTSTVIIMLISLSLQLISISLLFIFIVLFNRNSNNFLPIRDYAYYIIDVKKVFTFHAA